MKTKNKTTAYIIHSIAAAVLVLTAQTSLAGSATWLSSPQDSAWENANNWTAGGPPNAPSDIATFAQSSQTSVDISTSVEVNNIVFSSGSASFYLSISSESYWGEGILIISGTGVTNNSSVGQTFEAAYSCQIIFNNASTAGSALSIANVGAYGGYYDAGQTVFNNTSNAAGASIFNGGSIYGAAGGQTIFNDTSTADHVSITNNGAGPSANPGNPGQTTFNGTSTAANASIDNTASIGSGNGGHTIFNDTSTAGHATITNDGTLVPETFEGATIFNDSSTADSSALVGNGGSSSSPGGGIYFYGASMGGTARVEVFDYGYLDISGHQSGLTIGSIEGSGNIVLGANNLTVGTNDIDTAFSGVISGSGSLAKVGSGVLTLQANDCVPNAVGLILVTGSIINLDFTGSPDVIASLVVDGVPQPPGIYGGPVSGAPNILPEFGGSGAVSVGPISTLGNISTRAFVQTGDNVVIGGFIVQGTQTKKVIIRAIGPELGAPPYNVPGALANPTLELHDATGALIASNDNWHETIIGGIITSQQWVDILNSGYVPGDTRESAIIADLAPGNYTAIVRGVNDMTGVALVEVYDLSPEPDSILGNISTRASVQTGDNAMIGGFIVQGAQPKRVIIRAIGPELGAPPYNVPDALANPTLELHDATGALIASNDNWHETIIGGIITSQQWVDILNSGYVPIDTRESAIIAELPVGNYTAIVRGVNNTTGVALAEVYDLDQ